MCKMTTRGWQNGMLELIEQPLFRGGGSGVALDDGHLDATGLKSIAMEHGKTNKRISVACHRW